MDIEEEYTKLYRKREIVRNYMKEIQDILHYYGNKHNINIKYAKYIISTNPDNSPQPAKGLLKEYYDLLNNDFEYTKEIRELAKQLWEWLNESSKQI